MFSHLFDAAAGVCLTPKAAASSLVGTRIRTVFLTAAIAFFATCAGVSADTTGIIRGVVSVDGVPRPDVTVTITGEGTSAHTTSGTGGRFQFSNIAFGHYTIVAHAANLPDAQTGVDITTNSVADVVLALGAAREIGRVSGTTLGVGGNPVSVTTLGSDAIAASPQGQSLNRLIETAPGIVRFSYDEPVAHGFHGLTYEVDGAPVPQTSSANFSELIDPRNVGSLEIFTGAFPAEFGGQRMGGVVNIVTKRDIDVPNGSQTLLSAGLGTYGSSQFSLAQANRLGTTDIFLDLNTQRTNRGLDAPTRDAVHDGASLSDGLLRSITHLSARDTLSFNYSNQTNIYQIPINTVATSTDQIVNPANQDDVQREYNRFASVNYTHSSADGSSYFQVIPWYRSTRVVYAGDLANDVGALDFSAGTCDPAPAACALAGLAQDRRATELGLRLSYFHNAGNHALKFGIDGSSEAFTSSETIVSAGTDPFFDNVAQHGNAYSAYAQDTWTPSSLFSLQAGLRYDYSKGFTQGNQIQPRIGANLHIAPGTTLHAYYGRIYAAPSLEDTRRDAVIAGGGTPSDALPVYDLKAQTESYYEAGIAHAFGAGVNGYVNIWQRNAWNVLDTTQIFPTPLFAVFNNALGLAHGYELRLQGRTAADSWYLSGTFSQSVAGGISGSTFLFPPSAVSDTSLQPEDHDQAVALNGAYTRHFGRGRLFYATLGSEYGTGYPVQFENGSGRLLPHLTFDASIGRAPTARTLGFNLSLLNLTGYQYLIKVNNGFNTTQWAPGLQALLRIQALF
jgi:outer membrane receptor protein involved in Fe transport